MDIDTHVLNLVPSFRTGTELNMASQTRFHGDECRMVSLSGICIITVSDHTRSVPNLCRDYFAGVVRLRNSAQRRNCRRILSHSVITAPYPESGGHSALPELAPARTRRNHESNLVQFDVPMQGNVNTAH